MLPPKAPRVPMTRSKLTMPSPSLLIPWSKILSLALSRAPQTSPFGGPSRSSLSRDMASAANDLLLRADRLLAAIAFSGLTIAASLLARARCGDRLLLPLRRLGELLEPCRWPYCCWYCCCACCCCCSWGGGSWGCCCCWNCCCCCCSLCWEMREGWLAFAPRL